MKVPRRVEEVAAFLSRHALCGLYWNSLPFQQLSHDHSCSHSPSANLYWDSRVSRAPALQSLLHKLPCSNNDAEERSEQLLGAISCGAL